MIGSLEEVAMVTYRKELERKGWHRPPVIRVLLTVAGVLVVLLGWVMWTFEQDKGGWEGSGLGHFTVEEGIEDVEEGTYRALVRGEDGEVLFEGDSIEEVDAWIESQRSRDFTVPILVIVGGGLLIVAGVAPSPRRPERSEPRPRVPANA